MDSCPRPMQGVLTATAINISNGIARKTLISFGVFNAGCIPSSILREFLQENHLSIDFRRYSWNFPEKNLGIIINSDFENDI